MLKCVGLLNHLRKFKVCLYSAFLLMKLNFKKKSNYIKMRIAEWSLAIITALMFHLTVLQIAVFVLIRLTIEKMRHPRNFLKITIF